MPTRPDKLNLRPNIFQDPMTAINQDNDSPIQPTAIVASPKSNLSGHTSSLHQYSIAIQAKKTSMRPDKLN